MLTILLTPRVPKREPGLPYYTFPQKAAVVRPVFQLVDAGDNTGLAEQSEQSSSLGAPRMTSIAGNTPGPAEKKSRNEPDSTV